MERVRSTMKDTGRLEKFYTSFQSNKWNMAFLSK